VASGEHNLDGPRQEALPSPKSSGGEAMRRSICLALLLVVASPVLVMAQGSGSFAGVSQCYVNGTWVSVKGNCPSSGGGSGSGGGYSAGNPQLQQAVQQATTNFLNWLFNAGANAQAAAAQRQQMMEELQRRQAEAARLHREEEARRLAEMYNRLSVGLKLNGLPNLRLRIRGLRPVACK
jgi:hypothetical protein